AKLKQERQKERHCPDAGAINEAADDGGAHGRDLEQGEIEHRRGRTPRMQHVGIGCAGAHDDEREHHAGRRKLSPSKEPPKASPPNPSPASTRPSVSNAAYAGVPTP